MRYIRNALELVELTGGGASGTKAGHGKPSAICISAPRHGSTRVDFTVKRMICDLAEVKEMDKNGRNGCASRRGASSQRP